ncbi:MAG: hypothetical protein EU548_06100 [Promethearchaeota archaeon]|nr:MAG: hypothetical protein EU548_06100 [Candidatus Lokiarchaeota archaeon]
MGKLGKIAGLTELISLCIPIMLVAAYFGTPILIFYWIGGLLLVTGFGTFVLFIFDLIGLIFALLIIVNGILCITKEGKVLLVSGLITLILMHFYYIWMLNRLYFTLNFYELTRGKIILTPFISFYSILMSGILAIIGGARSWKK